MTTDLKNLKCISCDAVAPRDRNLEWWQCSLCVVTNQPRPRHREHPEPDHSAQLELGEVAP